MRQDFAKTPYYMKHLSDTVQYDSTHHYAVIRSSICTGEAIAGFRDRETGHFMDVMVIRNDRDRQQFMKQYGIDRLKKEY